MNYNFPEMANQQDDNITENLIERLRTGDISAFDMLYARYFKLLSVSAYFYLQDENEAMDIIQNLFLDIWEKRLYENFHADVKGYLFLAVRNRCFNSLKAKRRQQQLRSAYNLLHENDIVDSDIDLQDPNYAANLKQLLEGLKGQRKKALNLVYFQHKKYSEAAEEMGIGINSLKTHLKSALKTLRKTVKSQK